ncbi:MAG: hypothetical protein ABI584_15965 [Acidobacteriota bacterium]
MTPARYGQEDYVMRERRYSFLMSALGAALLVSAYACSKEPGTVERKSESTVQTAQGEVKTTVESKQAGNTLEAKTETKTDTGAGTIKGTVETFVGTVTKYEPGKKIEVMTGEKKTHSVTLDARDTTVSIDATVVVGSRVRLTEQTGDDKTRRVTVKNEG